MGLYKNKIVPRALLIAAIIIGVVLGLRQVRPPAPPSEGAAEYAAYRRMTANVGRLAANPRPSGSVEIERVHGEIIAEIEAMGLTAETQSAVYTASEIADTIVKFSGLSTKEEWWEKNSRWFEINSDIQSLDDLIADDLGGRDVLPLQNILIKLDAPGTERGVMFVSHYDSVPDAPGAADAMLPVCAMLEAMRTLAQNDALQNDIYFLLTDGEEMGLLGARKFVETNPELKDRIDMVINLEMRGNRGGVILFETSPDAYSMLRTVKRSGARIIGTSWAAAIYAMMPNNTDLTAFLDGGYGGVNFAGIEGVEHYHTPDDNYENLDGATAWHYLQTVLALSDYAANNDLSELSEPSTEAVYFPFLPGVLVLITVWASRILCAAACVFFLSYTLKLKKKELRVSLGFILMCLLVLLSVLSAVFFAAGSYLFYIPLMGMSITAMLRKRPIAHLTAMALSVISALLIWVPVVFLLWVSIVQPMML